MAMSGHDRMWKSFSRPDGRLSSVGSTISGLLRMERSLSRMLQPGGMNSWSGKKFAVITSGDDTQGMNACIRSIVRMGMYLGCTVIYIKNGLKGMIEGGDYFEEATWSSTSDHISEGGTLIRTSKCPEFKQRSSRLKAAQHLIEHNIFHLVAIGGDGTLSAITTFKDEWPSLVTELQDMDLITPAVRKSSRILKAVVVLSSVEHNIIGTDICLGSTSALQRIIECTDDIATTCSSKDHAFVFEIIGTWGYLALVSAIACDATMVFIPEFPPEGDWKDEVVEKVKANRDLSNMTIMIMICEGATDKEGNPICAEDVGQVLRNRLKMSVKITSLGHVQRGGTPNAWDRILGTRAGAEAVIALRDLPEEAGCCVVGTRGNDVIVRDAKDCIKWTKEVAQLIQRRDYAQAVRKRGAVFEALLSSYRHLHHLRPAPTVSYAGMDFAQKIGVLRLGSQTIGFCTVCKCIVAYCCSKGYTVVGIRDGFEGLVNNKVITLTWEMVSDYTYKSNTCLGSSRIHAHTVGFEKIAAALERHQINGLIIIGSFRAFESLWDLWNQQENFKGFCIPMLMVPASIINDIPGSDTSLGADTALNEIVSYCDKMRRVARGHGNVVFVIETLGRNCGYLTLMAALACGADAAYIKQHPHDLDRLVKDAHILRDKVLYSGVKLALVLRSEYCSENYDTHFIHKLYAEEGKGVFECRSAKIGHIQMGGVPTGFDRVVGTLQGLRAGEWMVRKIQDSVQPDGSVYTIRADAKSVLCTRRIILSFKPIAQLGAETDFDTKLPTYMWWTKLKPLLRILTKHYDEVYNIETDRDEEEEEERDNFEVSSVLSDDRYGEGSQMSS